jgi:dihydroxyacetone kinase
LSAIRTGSPALDGEIGDGDHGVTMAMGWNAVTRKWLSSPGCLDPADIQHSREAF